MILIEAYMDNMGNIHARPVSERWARNFAKHVEDFTGNYSESSFFQEGMNAADFLDGLPAHHRRDLERDWSIRFRADPWDVGHWYGYDAHTIAE